MPQTIRAAVAALALATIASVSPTAQPRTAAPRRIVLVGVDGADWLALDPLIRAGKLPTFARLRARGRTGVMLSTPPLISPMIWTTIATGVEPENHGILDFTADLPDGRQTPVGSSQRLAPALWNLFSHAGRSVAVIGWWATWPAEQVRGTIVSDAVAPQLARASKTSDTALVSPASKAQSVLTQVVRVDALKLEDVSLYAPVSREQLAAATRLTSDSGALYREPVGQLAAVVAATRTYAAIASRLASSERPDFLAVYLEGVDTLSHVFVKTATRGSVPAIERAYQDADSLIQALALASPPETLVVVCSDHGFYPATAGITENPSDLTGPATAWHRPYGIIGVATAGMLASGAADHGFRESMSLGVLTPLDIAPTLLHAAGLPVPNDMPGRVVSEMLPAEARDRQVARSAPPPYSPVPAVQPARGDADAVVARLQALGYIGASRTSLARQNLGESLLRRGKLAAAERELRAVLEAQPSNLFAQLWLAQALRRQGKTGAAISAYERAIALPGGAREALTAAVDLAIQSGDGGAVRRLIDVATRSEDARLAVLVAKGALAESERDLRRAEASYRAALQTDPLLFDASSRLFDLLAREGRAREALPILDKAVREAPDSPRHLALLGEARLASRDATGAESAFRTALQLAPDGDEIRIGLGRALMVQNKPDEALTIANAAGASPDRDVLLGAAYAAKKDFRRAVDHLRAALDAGRDTPEVLNGLGYGQLQLGQRQDAATMFERSLAIEPRQPQIRRLLDEIRGKGRGSR